MKSSPLLRMLLSVYGNHTEEAQVAEILLGGIQNVAFLLINNGVTADIARLSQALACLTSAAAVGTLRFYTSSISMRKDALETLILLHERVFDLVHKALEGHQKGEVTEAELARSMSVDELMGDAVRANAPNLLWGALQFTCG